MYDEDQGREKEVIMDNINPRTITIDGETLNLSYWVNFEDDAMTIDLQKDENLVGSIDTDTCEVTEEDLIYLLIEEKVIESRVEETPTNLSDILEALNKLSKSVEETNSLIKEALRK